MVPSNMGSIMSRIETAQTKVQVCNETHTNHDIQKFVRDYIFRNSSGVRQHLEDFSSYGPFTEELMAQMTD